MIIRNLSFQATEENILDKLVKFGPIVEVTIPKISISVDASKKTHRKKENVSEVLRPRGFGFVTYLCEKDALDAVNNSQGLKICNREVAIDFSMSKDIYTRDENVNSENQSIEIEENEFDEDQQVGKSDDDEDDVDDDDDEDDEDDDDDDVDNEDEGEEEEEEDDDDEQEDEDEDEQDNQNDNDNDNDNKSISSLKKELKSDVEENRTLFIRGMPFDSSEEVLRKAFRIFGKIELAIIVKDKLTGSSKGSAFVKFAHQESSKKCLSAISNGRDDGLGEILINDKKCL